MTAGSGDTLPAFPGGSPDAKDAAADVRGGDILAQPVCKAVIVPGSVRGPEPAVLAARTVLQADADALNGGKGGCEERLLVRLKDPAARIALLQNLLSRYKEWHSPDLMTVPIC